MQLPRHGGDGRVPILYLAPWVDYGGSDKGTIDWFRWIDRDRFAPSLITTQPSDNRRLQEIDPYAVEIWPLSDLMAGPDMPQFIMDFIVTRGVQLVHVMNSRLGYELLPDLAGLDTAPAVVVQLHVEEQDRSGYVRYVTTRYGNLVDAFSVTSEHLATVVEGYDVPRDRIHVIHTGVDAVREFAPARVRAPHDLGPGFHVLFPGRIVEQKDPLLMADVAAATVVRHPHVRFHVVGDGHLEPVLRAAVHERGLAEHVRFHPPTRELAPWYAASDVLLMTSVFEGVPYVAYEAMAMEVPVVAPALPGNVELLGADNQSLIEPRDDVGAYVDALEALIADPERRARVAAEGRERVLGEFSLERMGAEHSGLYERLLAGRPEPPRPFAPPSEAPLRFFRRPSRGTPKVSIVIPCFNHGRYLAQCLESIRAQTYPDLEVIVVDDASTDTRTRELLAHLEAEGDVRVVRQKVNQGPSVARNAGIARATGRYILPVDSDNLLLPKAVAQLVAQLQTAGERIGFVYANLQFFGNREDYFEAPAYNLFTLLWGNYCDTCSLIDREVFDAGLRYPDDIKLGHEDWDFALALGAREVYGEPARAKTLLYRKHGFTRSDSVEYASRAFHEEIWSRHDTLFGGGANRLYGRHSGPPVAIKAQWAPALSIVALEDIEPATEAGRRLAERLRSQSSVDFEVIAHFDGSWPLRSSPPHVRRLPPALTPVPAQRLQEALSVARAARVLVVERGLSALVADRGFVEKLQRGLCSPELDGIAFADAGDDGRFSFRLLQSDEAPDARPHALLWKREVEESRLPDPVQIDSRAPVDSLALSMASRGASLQWRHAPAAVPNAPSGSSTWLRLRARQAVGPSARAEERARLAAAPGIPAAPHGLVRRWTLSGAWGPPGTVPLVRHREQGGERRVVTNDRRPPEGFEIEFDLGSIQAFSPLGTVRLERTASDEYRTRERGEPVDDDAEVLGYLETAPFPLLDAVELAHDAVSGADVLVAGPEDPLRGRVEVKAFVGWIESYPNNPRRAPHAERTTYGLRGLLRVIDPAARRHRYTVEKPAQGRVVGELGALHTSPGSDSIPVYIDGGGTFSTDRYAPRVTPVGLRAASRWAVAPLGWRGFGHRSGRIRAVGRRATLVPGLAMPSPARGPEQRTLVGYLLPDPGPDRVMLHSATHPVTGDQLLTLHPMEAADMGYGEAVPIGHLVARAPVTGQLGIRRYTTPWASRFGLRIRQG